MVKGIFYRRKLFTGNLLWKLTFLQVNDPYGTGIHNEEPAIIQGAKHVLWDTGVEEAELEAVGAQALGDVKELVGDVCAAL